MRGTHELRCQAFNSAREALRSSGDNDFILLYTTSHSVGAVGRDCSEVYLKLKAEDGLPRWSQW